MPGDNPVEFSGTGDGAFLDEDLRGADHSAFAEVLGEVVDALEEAAIPHALIGGIASSGLGRPRWTHDIDVLVKPEDAGPALEALAGRGFVTERTDLTWLYKAFKHQVMVDIIFKSSGNIYLDEEMLERAVEGSFQGHRVRFIPAEDLLIMKAIVHDEGGPRHWHDALGLIARKELDWDYLRRRARRAPRRVLSLLLYAHSLDLTVPNHVVRELFHDVYES
jgi:predicted nucleotidyltransferase